MTKNVLVLMTALLPTIGHKALIDFASIFAGMDGQVNVIVSARSFEPIAGEKRVDSLLFSGYPFRNVCVLLHEDDNAPQNPSTTEEWDYWKQTALIQQKWKNTPFTHVIASEAYGKKMAELLGADFVPFDIDRKLFPVKSTDIRKLPLDPDNFVKILPEFRKNYLVKRIVLFGQESCGKTTMTKKLHETFSFSHMKHEFARPYLEMMDDKIVTDAKMATITEGEFALQVMHQDQIDAPFLFSDTDLLSTIGYYRIYGGEKHDDIEEMFEETKGHLYIVMNDEIPFEEDALRYGGKERESTKQFWIDLLEEYECNYYVVKSTNPIDQLNEIGVQVIKLMMNEGLEEIANFVRD